MYLALKIPVNSSLFNFSFTGYASGESLKIVNEKDITTDVDNNEREVYSFPDLLDYNQSINDPKQIFSTKDDAGIIVDNLTINNHLDPIGIKGDMEIENNLTLKQFSSNTTGTKALGVDNTGKVVLSIPSPASLNCYSFKGATLDATLPAVGSKQIDWFRIGTLTIPQQGHNALIRMYAGGGYNANQTDNGHTDLFIRTSNAGANAAGFYFSAIASHFGQNAFVEQIKIKQTYNSVTQMTTLEVFIKAKNFIGQGFYTVETSSGSNWYQDCSAAATSKEPQGSDVYSTPFEFRTLDDTYLGGENGSVFIGNTSSHPSNTKPFKYKLDVAGKVRADKIVVNTTGADFVFDTSYKVPTLKNVEDFVKKEHHLPGIASAADMQKDGLDIGDNQTKLLQKIEELTLYLIQQNKTLQQQAEKIKKLEKLVKSK